MVDELNFADDPRMTAYALGELSPEESREIERQVADSLAAQAAVREIRELAGVLQAGLQSEPVPALREEQRAAILVAAAGASVDTSRSPDFLSGRHPNAMTAKSVNSSARIENPGYGRRAAMQSPRRCWAGWLASLATVAAVALVGALVVSTTKNGARTRTRHELQKSLLIGQIQNKDVLPDSYWNEERFGKTPVFDSPAPSTVLFDDSQSGQAEGQPMIAESRLSFGVGVHTTPASREISNFGTPAPETVRLAEPGANYGSESQFDRFDNRRFQFRSDIGDGAGARPSFTTDTSRPAQEYILGQTATPAKASQPGRTSELSERDYSEKKPVPAPARQERFAPGQGQRTSSITQTLSRRGRELSDSARGSRKLEDQQRHTEAEAVGNNARQANGGRSLSGLKVEGTSTESGVVTKLQRGVVPMVTNGGQNKGQAVEKPKELPTVTKGAGVDLSFPNGPDASGFLIVGNGITPIFSHRVLDETLGDTFDLSLAQSAPSTESYTPITENHFVAPLSEPLSTFGVDVDTASYSNMRRFLNEGQLPPPDAVRVEELVNYFRYETPAAPVDERPFAVAVEVGAAPWQPAHRLVRIGLKGREIAADKRPASNLVFLVDVSGSMQSENKLPLAKSGLKLLAGQMTENDRVAIVTYSSTATLRLTSTNGTNRQAILETIDALQAGGSTNGAGGIQLAYGTAIENFIDGGVNRVILCTDGDFNVGVTGDDELVKMIEERARTKIFFSVFGFGMGNLKDGKLEKLADKGNGHYGYIDGPREAKKMFVDELAGTLVTIAKDVKVQVEFNPARVAAYRLIGYENRALAARDFDDDNKDAGDIGAGHSVTALYEVVPAPEAPPAPAAEGLRYQRVGLATAGDVAKELLAVKLRYKQPEADVSSLIEVPVADIQSAVATNPPGNEPASLRQRPSRDFEWSAAVAAFGMVLRDSSYRGQAGFDLILELAQGAKGEDPTGQRREFIELVERAKSLRPDLASTAPTTPPTPGAAPPVSAPQGLKRVDPIEVTRQTFLQQRAIDGNADGGTFPPLTQEQLDLLTRGKYTNLRRIVPERRGDNGEPFKLYDDLGYQERTSYLSHNNLPKGYWVYVYPNWYIWGDAAEGAAPIPTKRPIPPKRR